jgi:butyryl-CoA dehydrogenase
VLSRTLKLIGTRGAAASATAVAITNVYLTEAFARVEQAAKKVMADVADGDMLRTQMTILRRLVKSEPVNTIAAREKIAATVLEAGKYAF